MGNFGDIPTLVKNVQKSAMLFMNTYMHYLQATKTVTRHKNSLEYGAQIPGAKLPGRLILLQ
jgi:hypothetical protein